MEHKRSYKPSLPSREKAYTVVRMALPEVPAAARSWGAGTAAIVRLLVASDRPFTQVEIARSAGVTQPRASQVLKRLASFDAVRVTPTGYRGRPGRLLDLYARRARPALVDPETPWYSTRPLVEQVMRLVDAARSENVRLAVSADLGPDLLVPWRHPTVAIVYVDRPPRLDDVGFVRAEGRADASVLMRWTNDTTLLVPNPPWPREVDEIPLADPVQQWRDLLDLGGEDRREAAARLRRAIVDRSLPERA